MLPNPYCCPACSTFMRAKTNGVTVCITFENDRPYEIYMADLWACPACGHEMLAGFGDNPLSTHLDDHFLRRARAAHYTINGKLRALHDADG